MSRKLFPVFAFLLVFAFTLDRLSTAEAPTLKHMVVETVVVEKEAETIVKP